MSDRAISKDAMLTSLRDIRLPADAPGGAIADFAVAVGLACIMAMMLAAVLRLLSIRSRQRTPDRLQDRLAALVGRSEAERRLELLHLLRAHAPERYEALKPGLYKPSGGVDAVTLEAEVARLV